MFLKTRLIIGVTLLAFVAINIRVAKERFLNRDANAFKATSVLICKICIKEYKSNLQ